MNCHISELEPKIVWTFFDEITKIPRPSGKEHKILAYLIKFAEEYGLEYKSDEVNNLVICKSAQNSNSKDVVILQGHVDMVCEKNNDKIFNFENDSIETYCEDGWVKARGTTLGADCGIGVALMLSLLASKDISHPPLEALFTVDEESGMTGAMGLSKDILSGNLLINLDSEDEGEIFVGCAGGLDSLAYFDITREKLESDASLIKIDVKGLKGGHSGDDINKGHANANLLLGGFLVSMIEKYGVKLVDINGGNLRNAIPREACAILAINTKHKESIIKELASYETNILEGYKSTDADIYMSATELAPESYSEYVSFDISKNIIRAIVSVPNGVVKMSSDIKGLVETSTNLASIKVVNNQIVVTTSQRSSVEKEKLFIAAMMKSVFESCGAHVVQSDGYPGWAPKMDSKLLSIFEKSYSDLFGCDAKVKAVHAGLECGLFLEKYPHMDMVSVGPTLRRVHSPEEMLEIETVAKFWVLIKDVMQRFD